MFVFQFPYSVGPATWFDLWDAIDEYLTIAASGQPLIIRGDAYAPEEWNLFESFRFESVVDRMVPVSMYMFTSYVRTTFRYVVDRQLREDVLLRNTEINVFGKSGA